MSVNVCSIVLVLLQVKIVRTSSVVEVWNMGYLANARSFRRENNNNNIRKREEDNQTPVSGCFKCLNREREEKRKKEKKKENIAKYLS